MGNHLTISEIMELVFTEYKLNGYIEMWQPQKISIQEQKIRDVAELGLIITEVSESIEEVRKNFVSDLDLVIELADIIIRTMNFASRKNLDLEEAIINKHSINLSRTKLHGKGV